MVGLYFSLVLCIILFLSARSEDEWRGAWFPRNPEIKLVNISNHQEAEGESHHVMGVSSDNCDNAVDNLNTDFDPYNSSHKMMYTCLEDTYNPSYNTTPFLTIYEPPANYLPNHLCMDVELTYNYIIPVVGAHRPLWPKYGEYEFCPVQRWLHSVEHGAIVLLYHPCANRNELNKFKNLLKGCLYRYIITPYNLLSKERPFTLAAWGVSLEMSVFEETLLTFFIKKHSKTGPEKNVWQNGQYSQLLLEPSVYLQGSDKEDINICPK